MKTWFTQNNTTFDTCFTKISNIKFTNLIVNANIPSNNDKKALKIMQKTLILGIGNLLWADEGFGVRAVETLHQHYQFDDNVTLMDGGTQGIYLVQFVEDADILVVFDAIDYGLEAGTIKLIEGDDVPKFMGAKQMSLHQTGFQEVLMMADMLGRYPKHLLLVGVQPCDLEDFGGSLHDSTRQQIQPAINAALNWLKTFNIIAKKRTTPLANDQLLAGDEINISNYEKNRPSAQQASRIGDDRVLNSTEFTLEYKPHPLDSKTIIACDVDHRGKY